MLYKSNFKSVSYYLFIHSMKKLLISLCFANTANAFFEVSRARPAEVDPDPCPETGCLSDNGGRVRLCGRYRLNANSETKMICTYQNQCQKNSLVNSRSVYVYCNIFRNPPNGYKCPKWQRHRTTTAEQTEVLRCRADVCTPRYPFYPSRSSLSLFCSSFACIMAKVKNFQPEIAESKAMKRPQPS